MSLDAFFNQTAHTTHWSSDGTQLGWDQQDPTGLVTHHDAQGQLSEHTIRDSLGNFYQYDQSGHLLASAHAGPLDQTQLLDGQGHLAGRIDHAHDHLFLADSPLPITGHEVGGGHTRFDSLPDPLVHLQTIRFAHFAS